MPRSGTTWLARLLASAPFTALTGREPMNPRGRQYALAGTLSGWARIEQPCPRQRRALRTSYLGLNPLVYSRYGHRQCAAPFPGVKVVVKDPFAMLSIPAVQEVTGAAAILLYRHPGAALSSYRRMGWTPDLGEVGPIVEHFLARHGPAPGVTALSQAGELDEVGEMTWFWNALYGMALHDVERLGRCMVLAHQDVAQGGPNFCQGLFAALGLRWSGRVAAQLVGQDSVRSVVDASALHNFGRPPAAVAQEWKGKVTPEERERLDTETVEILSLLAERAYQPRHPT